MAFTIRMDTDRGSTISAVGDTLEDLLANLQDKIDQAIDSRLQTVTELRDAGIELNRVANPDTEGG